MKTLEACPETQAVVEKFMTGKPIDPEIRKQIREKARQIKERVLREQGLVDLAVPGVRDFRGDIPE